MNTVALIGRLTRNPVQKQTQGAHDMVEMSTFTLAVDRRFKGNGEQAADFIRCVAFGKQAEVINQYCGQGTKLGITGRIQTGSYTNKDGQTVYTTDIIVEGITFCESKKAEGTHAESVPDEFTNIPDDLGDEGLPFK